MVDRAADIPQADDRNRQGYGEAFYCGENRCHGRNHSESSTEERCSPVETSEPVEDELVHRPVFLDEEGGGGLGVGVFFHTGWNTTKTGPNTTVSTTSNWI